jgi:hypothetical protein
MNIRSVIVGLFCTVKRWFRRRIKPVSIPEGARVVVRVEPEFQINAVGPEANLKKIKIEGRSCMRELCYIFATPL